MPGPVLDILSWLSGLIPTQWILDVIKQNPWIAIPIIIILGLLAFVCFWRERKYRQGRKIFLCTHHHHHQQQRNSSSSASRKVKSSTAYQYLNQEDKDSFNHLVHDLELFDVVAIGSGADTQFALIHEIEKFTKSVHHDPAVDGEMFMTSYSDSDIKCLHFVHNGPFVDVKSDQLISVYASYASSCFWISSVVRNICGSSLKISRRFDEMMTHDERLTRSRVASFENVSLVFDLTNCNSEHLCNYLRYGNPVSHVMLPSCSHHCSNIGQMIQGLIGLQEEPQALLISARDDLRDEVQVGVEEGKFDDPKFYDHLVDWINAELNLLIFRMGQVIDSRGNLDKFSFKQSMMVMVNDEDEKNEGKICHEIHEMRAACQWECMRKVLDPSNVSGFVNEMKFRSDEFEVNALKVNLSKRSILLINQTIMSDTLSLKCPPESVQYLPLIRGDKSDHHIFVNIHPPDHHDDLTEHQILDQKDGDEEEKFPLCVISSAADDT